MSLFFYNDDGDAMKVYMDLLLLFNFFIDLLLLMSVSVVLKRMTSFYRLSLGAFLGSFSVFILFLPISNFLLFILKVLISALMIISTFSYRSFSYFLKNMGYFYFSSMVLGGMIYLWNTTFSFEGVESSFLSNSYQLNFLGLILLSPICIAYYIRKMKSMKEQYQFYKSISFVMNNNMINGVGFCDSGNTLTYKSRPVILASKTKLVTIPKTFFIPYQTVHGAGLLKCFSVKEVWIEGCRWKNIYLGIMDEDIKIDGIDFLLHNTMIGGNYDKENMEVS